LRPKRAVAGGKSNYAQGAAFPYKPSRFPELGSKQWNLIFSPQPEPLGRPGSVKWNNAKRFAFKVIGQSPSKGHNLATNRLNPFVMFQDGNKDEMSVLR